MLDHIQAAPPRLKQRGFSFFIGVIASLTLMTIMSSAAQAATPLAGATISNQATANYTDSGGSPQTATSNSVTTTVAQVGSYTLTADNTKTAAPGTTVYMPHTLTNTGNGSDNFTISLPATEVTAPLTGIAIYADANADGQPDSTTPLCTVTTCTNVQTGSLASGDAFHFVVALTVSATAGNGVSATEVVTAVPATGALYPTGTASPPATNGAEYGLSHEKINTDTLTVSNNTPVFAVNKSIISSLATGPSGTVVEYKLAYTNSGNAAGPLYIKDVIGTGSTANFKYVTGDQAKWSGSGSGSIQVFDDAIAPEPTGILYQAVTVPGTTSLEDVTTIEALIASVPANASGFITFKVIVDTDAPLGTSGTTNIANYIGESCSGALPCTPTGTPTTTNQSPFTVTGAYSVVANNSPTVSTDGDNATAVNEDLVTAAAVAPGQVVSFDNYIWNTGTVTDTFNISYDAALVGGATAFPSGTTFQLFKTDGNTPLTSSDADGIPDTGPLAPGASYKVVLKATIPANACSVIDCDPLTGLKNFTVAKIATSTGSTNPTVANGGKNIVFDQLAAITPPTVDLTNLNGDDTVNDGADAVGSTVSPVTTVSVAPGATAYFNLDVANNGLANDNYNLSYHLLQTGSDLTNAAEFTPGTLLAGWTVTFHVNSSGTNQCTSSTLGAVVSNTGTVVPGVLNTKHFCAVVTTPASGTTALAGTYKTYFRVISGATGAVDYKPDAVTLNPLNNLTLTPPGTGQIQPGGTIVYPHILANGGNSSCGANFKFTVTNSQASNGWSYTLYFDVNGDGVVDPSDKVIGGGTSASETLAYQFTDSSSVPIPLTAGTNVKLLVKVQAPSGATSGELDAINITAFTPETPTPTCGPTSPIADTTTVLAGQIRLVKTQALGTWSGTDCGTVPAVDSFASATLSQKPGECVWYRVVATNDGDADVSAVTINDATPTFTTYGGGGACAQSSGVTGTATLGGAGTASVGSAGAVTCASWTTVPPQATTQLDFAVRINP